MNFFIPFCFTNPTRSRGETRETSTARHFLFFTDYLTLRKIQQNNQFHIFPAQHVRGFTLSYLDKPWLQVSSLLHGTRRLIIMRIRFRPSDFSQVAKLKIFRAKSKQASCAEMDGARVICLFARLIQQLGFWTQGIQANVCYYCDVRRRAECTSVGPGFPHLWVSEAPRHIPSNR